MGDNHLQGPPDTHPITEVDEQLQRERKKKKNRGKVMKGKEKRDPEK